MRWFHPLLGLSTVTRFTEGLLKNNLNYLLGSGNPLHDPSGRQIFDPNSLIYQAIGQGPAGHAHAHAAASISSRIQP